MLGAGRETSIAVCAPRTTFASSDGYVNSGIYRIYTYKMALAGTADVNVSAPFCAPNASQQPIGVHANYANQFNCLDRQAIGRHIKGGQFASIIQHGERRSTSNRPDKIAICVCARARTRAITRSRKWINGNSPFGGCRSSSDHVNYCPIALGIGPQTYRRLVYYRKVNIVTVLSPDKTQSASVIPIIFRLLIALRFVCLFAQFA